MKRDDRSPQHYIDSVRGEQKSLLLKVRQLIQDVAPDAVEYIEYGMLAYGELANLAAQKHYVSLYVSPEAMALHQKNYPNIRCGKCCLRMKSQDDVAAFGVKELLEFVRDQTK